VAQPLLLHLPIQDRQLMFAILAVAELLDLSPWMYKFLSYQFEKTTA
jgi:hypothetical protein